jgi:ribonucleotide monophosphatase NagD (HAD superfamily)
MVGDIGSDIDAAINAGVNAILVPTPITRAEEIARAPVVCADLDDAVDRILEAVPVS